MQNSEEQGEIPEDRETLPPQEIPDALTMLRPGSVAVSTMMAAATGITDMYGPPYGMPLVRSEKVAKLDLRKHKKDEEYHEKALTKRELKEKRRLERLGKAKANSCSQEVADG